jgi:hypothetical protein
MHMTTSQIYNVLSDRSQGRLKSASLVQSKKLKSSITKYLNRDQQSMLASEQVPISTLKDQLIDQEDISVAS